MEARKRHINELQDILHITKNGDNTIDISAGNMICKVLNNALTYKHCNVIECISNDSNTDNDNLWVGDHIHDESQEVFYQVKGRTRFGDGTSIGPGEFKIILKGDVHKVTLERDSVVIVIAHPPLKELERD